MGWTVAELQFFVGGFLVGVLVVLAALCMAVTLTRAAQEGSLKFVYVNKIRVAQNAARNQDLPVITVEADGRIVLGHEVCFLTEPPVRLVYCPELPLESGARVWLESTAKLEVIEHGYPTATTTEC